MERDLGTNPVGWSHRWCGAYLGRVVRAIGYAPPPGFALAASWRRFGAAAAGPAPGYVAWRYGHVGVVRRVLGNGQVELISGNFNHRVGIGVYPASRFAYRVP